MKTMAACHLGILPGRGGLAIQELLWYGLPVISGVADGTERDLIRDGKNGFLNAGFIDVEYLVEKIKSFHALSGEKKQQMSIQCLRTIKNQSNTDLMGSGFDEAIQATLKNREVNSTSKCNT